MLEGDFKKDAFNLEKTYNWSYFKRGDQVKYVKDMDCIVVELSKKFFLFFNSNKQERESKLVIDFQHRKRSENGIKFRVRHPKISPYTWLTDAQIGGVFERILQ